MSAMMLAACSSEELSAPDTPKEVTGNAVVKFDAYALRGLTRAGVTGDVTNDNIGTTGFGIFAYYTKGTTYGTTATPDFMYNQKVTKTAAGWTYEPAKYWPNEYGETASSEKNSYVSFFAYAPWTEFVPTTGKPVVTGSNDAIHDQNFNIIGVKDNAATGDPVVQYVVDTDPSTSVDLLWGVAAEDPTSYYKPIAGTQIQEVGKPFLNMMKPESATDSKLKFNLRHALAKVKITVDYIADAFTPTGTSAVINADETRIYIREAAISGFALQGALNLNNTIADEPLWRDVDGEKNLVFEENVEFFDGRRDGYEGTENGFNKGESNIMLNPTLVENYCAPELVGDIYQFGGAKTPGVTKDTQFLFISSASIDPTAEDEGFFYVIPRNAGQNVDIRLLYDVETIDGRVAGLLADRVTHGKSVPNDLTEQHIFGSGVDFEPGKQYVIKIHLGMNSIKVDAEVTEWTETNPVEVEVPSFAEAVQSAINYTYADRAYSGTWSITDAGDPLTVTYSNTLAQAASMEDTHPYFLNDMARMLGALYRAGGVRKITFQDTEYTWNASLGLKGSNWANGTTTLVSAMAAAFGASIPSSVSIETDMGTINLVFDVH